MFPKAHVRDDSNGASVAVMKRHDQKQIGKERVYTIWFTLPFRGLSLKEVEAGTQAGLEPGVRS